MYRHGGYVSFFVSDPKWRHIHKASVRDRLLHHALHRIIEPIWDRKFIFDSWSSRKGKGTHHAVARLQRMALAMSQNNTRTLWMLKLDIRKFFGSINHKILLSLLEKQTSDNRLTELFQGIIASHTPGLPLGNLTSQLFANVYLNQLDQFVKHTPKVHGYIRYADDFVLFHPRKDQLLVWFEEIAAFLRTRLCLELHQEKISLKTYASGVDYLGYICFPHHCILRTKTKRRILARVTLDNFPSYNGVLQHCRSQKLQNILYKRALVNHGCIITHRA